MLLLSSADCIRSAQAHRDLCVEDNARCSTDRFASLRRLRNRRSLRLRAKVRGIVTSSSYACNNQFLAFNGIASPQAPETITTRRNECSSKKLCYAQPE